MRQEVLEMIRSEDLLHSAVDLGYQAIGKGLVPDLILRTVIRRICGQRLDEQSVGGIVAQQARKDAFFEARAKGPIARYTEDANRQHYEVPSEFYQTVLGPRRKYSCCYYPRGHDSLKEAEESMLELTCNRAQIRDGQQILDLGCGWGALSLWLCEKYPSVNVVAISNSASQKQFIDEEAHKRGFSQRLRVLTCDVNQLSERAAVLPVFDRIVSVEMFEHVWNSDALLTLLAKMLSQSGRIFLHVFSHTTFAYPFEDEGSDDWMARTFFTGGTMPSDDLLLRTKAPLVVDQGGHYRLSGIHYKKTAEAWLSRFDEAGPTMLALLGRIYGEKQALRWRANWRLFFLACAEMFGYEGGTQWGVSHYRFRRS